jgi:hypothetical protein
MADMHTVRRNSPKVYTTSSCHISYFPLQAITMLHDGDANNLVDPQLHGELTHKKFIPRVGATMVRVVWPGGGGEGHNGAGAGTASAAGADEGHDGAGACEGHDGRGCGHGEHGERGGRGHGEHGGGEGEHGAATRV